MRVVEVVQAHTACPSNSCIGLRFIDKVISNYSGIEKT